MALYKLSLLCLEASGFGKWGSISDWGILVTSTLRAKVSFSTASAHRVSNLFNKPSWVRDLMLFFNYVFQEEVEIFCETKHFEK